MNGQMKRVYIFRDGTVQASTATRELALNLIREYQSRETHPFLKASFSIIEGEEELIPYPSREKRHTSQPHKSGMER